MGRDDVNLAGVVYGAVWKEKREKLKEGEMILALATGCIT
jgi:hypothetical protein